MRFTEDDDDDDAYSLSQRGHEMNGTVYTNNCTELTVSELVSQTVCSFGMLILINTCVHGRVLLVLIQNHMNPFYKFPFCFFDNPPW